MCFIKAMEALASPKISYCTFTFSLKGSTSLASLWHTQVTKQHRCSYTQGLLRKVTVT